jgi:hypothetical protein
LITPDLEVRDIVKAMAHSDPSYPLTSDSELTIEKLKERFRYIKESTGSNPKGLHHGHWKSLIQDDDAFKPFALMIMFAFRWAEPPEAWKNALEVILPKDDPTKPIKSTRIRRIQLVCAGMNMGFQIIWGHEMMQRATLYNHLSNVQFGARSGHMSLSAVLLKRTSYHIIRLMQHVATIFNCDATACYDRMIPSQCMILIDTNVGFHTLGARLAPSGTDLEEFSYQKKEGMKMRKRMLRAPLNRESTVIGFRSIARTKMDHTLPTTCFSVKQCEAIQSTYLPTFLSKMGINKNTRLEVRFGPAIYTGMEVPEVSTTQAAGANKMLVSHLRKK